MAWAMVILPATDLRCEAESCGTRAESAKLLAASWHACAPYRRHVCLLWARRPNLKRKPCAHSRPTTSRDCRCCIGARSRCCRRARGLGRGDSRAGLSCVDDSTECVDQRQATLKSMLADKDRTWVKEPATPQAHASGVRLFAFRSTKGGADLRGAGAWPQGGGRRAQGAQGRPRPFARTDLPRLHVRCRGQQGAVPPR